MGINVYIFDFDGTLADSKECSVTSTQKAFGEMGLTIPSENEIKNYMGIPIEISFKRMCKEQLTQNEFEKLLSLFRKIYREYENDLISIFSHVDDVLREIRNNKKFLFIVSSKNSIALKRNLQTLGIYELFDGVIGADHVDHYKPHPDGINRILKGNNFNRFESMMIGDSTYDIQMAKSANVLSCGVTWGVHSESELKKENPEYLIHNIKELLNI